MGSRDLLRTVATGTILVLVAATVVWYVFLRDNTTRITSYFDSAVGVYAGSDVRVLGVKVGTVDSVEAQGDVVKVVLIVDNSVPVPADAQAAEVSPSVVADRYVQLLPAYSGGDRMASGGEIPRERTATPVELDQLYSSLNDISKALGPDGANANGALSQLLDTTAANLDGNGAALGGTLTELSKAVDTLASSRGDLFGTVTNLQKFVSVLAANDTQVRQLNTQLQTFSGYLAGERSNLGQALQQLSVALGDVAGFVQANRESLSSNVAGLSSITGTLVNQRAALAETLDDAPLAAGNLLNSYNSTSGTLDTRVNVTQLSDPGQLVCSLVNPKNLAPSDPALAALGAAAQPLLNACKGLLSQPGGVLDILPLQQIIQGIGAGVVPTLPIGSLTGAAK
ncbi:MCE family protein [Rhodococcus antarcticus]|jgi:phospholipid/cholesterol/gamma-HCH transport system substrate-binding protein|uniref:MCE family protein n=1 Tax=Rhodococcus antarcticus TaxID=2987751 RepID=A0ABY6P1U3_9NOCA|nr:MCE family protein [Rhodococcus antarcticus]UZJ25311.1 MCE family protein [Rhodococcus antarcticus]